MVAKYNTYSNFKDVGIEWLGEIPENWDVWKLNHFTPIITCGVAATPEYFDDGVVFLSAQNIKNGKVDLDKGYKHISKIKHDELTKKRAPQNGDILLSRVGTVGEACIVNVDFEFSIFVSLTHLRLEKKVCINEFFVYLCQSAYVEGLHGALTLIGGGVGNLNVNDLREYQLPIPSVSEQTQIANFLDHETAKIDTLIEKQQQLIQLLKEKRQAVISHAVTKGLNPDVPMKDSGVEWLGEVPDRWKVMQFRRITFLQQGLQIPQGKRFAGPGKSRVEYITIKSINAGSGRRHKEFIESPSKRVVCNPTEVLLARTGATGEVVTNISGAFHNNFFKVNYNNQKINKEYLVFLLKVNELKKHLIMLAGTTTIPDLNHGAFLGTKICLPNLEKQRQISLFLDKELSRYNNLINKAKEFIELLIERRTALISAAVTGKIDVRNWKSQQETQIHKEKAV